MEWQKHQDIVELLQKFGPSLKKLWFEEVKYFCRKIKASEVETLLEFTPNIEWLVMKVCSKDLPLEDSDKSGSELNLKKLRELIVDGDNDSRGDLNFLTRLPPNGLTKLNLRYIKLPLNFLENFLSQQKNINQLAIIGVKFIDGIPESLIDGVALKRLSWHGEMNPIDMQVFINMASKQITLTHLKLRSIKLTDKMLATITESLQNLETFVLHITYLSAEGIKVIAKLKKLTNLELQECYFTERNGSDDGSDDIYRSFSELDNSRLEVLTLVFVPETISSSVRDIARSAPNLKELHVYEATTYEVVFAVIQNFRRVKLLRFENQHIDLLLEDGCMNENLETLTLEFESPYTYQHIKKLIENYPNLKKLEMVLNSIRNRFMLRDLRVMLKRWKKLTHLSFNWCQGNTLFMLDDFDIFLDYGQQLKFISMTDLTLTEEEKRKIRKLFREKYSVIEFNHDGVLEENVNLILATDYKTRYEASEELKIEI